MAKRPRKKSKTAPPTPISTPASSNVVTFDRPLGSVEAAQRLTAILQRLQNDPKLNELATKRLGEFWDPAWMRAPFEEELTFQQVLRLPPRALLEKRSVSPRKLLNIITAIEYALDGRKIERPAPPLRRPAAAPVSIDISPASDFVTLATQLVERYKQTASEAPDPLAALLATQMLEPPPEELQALLLVSDEELNSIAAATGSSAQTISGFRDLARQKLRTGR